MVTVRKGIIGHQTNILGKAGSGVVTSIRDSFTAWYIQYKDLCTRYENNKEALLGTVQYTSVGSDVFVADLFAQFSIKPFNRNTDLNALRECLIKLHETAVKHNLPVYLPNLIACVRGGMDWEVEVYPIIQEIFEDSSVILYLVDYVEGKQL